MLSNSALPLRVIPLLLVVHVHAAGPTPLPFAHAHNDYLHHRPLLDALDNGFCSVEADIFLVDGRLLVAHTKHELSGDRTLQGLYLDPLRRRIKQNGGRVHRNGPTFTLLIDIKNTGTDTWQELNRVLADYSDVVSRVEDGEFHEAAVTAIVSGDRAFDLIESTSPRFAGIDGRISDIGSNRSTHLMPLISDNWGLHFRWRGQDRISDKEREKLRRLVRETHDENRRIRFWATPDTAAVWRELRDAGVDLINTDDLPGLSSFLRSGAQESVVLPNGRDK